VFVAVTVHEYRLPGVRCLTPSGLAAPIRARVAPPSGDRHTALKRVIAAPLLPRALNATLRESGAIFVAVVTLGAAGAPIVTGFDGADDGPMPPPFAAATVKVTVVPSVRSGTTVVVPWPRE
jgi:hypothetical protein